MLLNTDSSVQNTPTLASGNATKHTPAVLKTHAVKHRQQCTKPEPEMVGMRGTPAQISSNSWDIEGEKNEKKILLSSRSHVINITTQYKTD